MTLEERNHFIAGLNTALSNVRHNRYFETERGYQGALIAELQKELFNINWDGAIIEQEYQKRMKEHGINIRPDIIVHVPFSPTNQQTRSEGNFVVFELKLNAREADALSDLENLSNMCGLLDYPLAVFININGNTTYIDKYVGENKDKLIAFNVKLSNNQVSIVQEMAIE